MNLSQLHERLRLEMLRRVQRGSLSVSLLARQAGFVQSHISNFLHSRRQLSLEAMDRILSAQHLTAADLLPAAPHAGFWLESETGEVVPVVSHAAAIFEPLIRPGAVQSVLRLSPHALASVHSRAVGTRRAWQRFVAVRVPAAEALPMEPLVLPEAIAVIDRHYNSLAPYRPNRPNLYAVRHLSRLTLRYADFLLNRLVLRPLNGAFPVELVEVAPGEAPHDLLTGRVALIVNEL
jgi:hypothetical protein